MDFELCISNHRKIWYAVHNEDYVLLGRSNTMERKKVWAVYFSATDTTKKTVLTIADEAARLLGAEREDYDFTLPGMRENGFAAGKDDLGDLRERRSMPGAFPMYC